MPGSELSSEKLQARGTRSGPLNDMGVRGPGPLHTCNCWFPANLVTGRPLLTRSLPGKEPRTRSRTLCVTCCTRTPKSARGRRCSVFIFKNPCIGGPLQFMLFRADCVVPACWGLTPSAVRLLSKKNYSGAPGFSQLRGCHPSRVLGLLVVGASF